MHDTRCVISMQNPLNEARRAEVTELAKAMLGTFTTQYALGYKNALVAKVWPHLPPPLGWPSRLECVGAMLTRRTTDNSGQASWPARGVAAARAPGLDRADSYWIPGQARRDQEELVGMGPPYLCGVLHTPMWGFSDLFYFDQSCSKARANAIDLLTGRSAGSSSVMTTLWSTMRRKTSGRAGYVTIVSCQQRPATQSVPILSCPCLHRASPRAA